ncbi:MAG: ribosome-associated translation inhibitor RaiA [Tepidisphaeraceae bacterium]
MNVVVSSRHMEVSPAIKQYAEEKAGKLTKYYDRIQEIEVTIDAVKGKSDPLHVSMIVNGEHKNLFNTQADGDDAYKLIDACVKTLERQLSDHHKKIKNRKHPE